MSVDNIYDAVERALNIARDQGQTQILVNVREWFHLSNNVPHRRYSTLIEDALTTTQIVQNEVWVLSELETPLFMIMRLDPDAQIARFSPKHGLTYTTLTAALGLGEADEDEYGTNGEDQPGEVDNPHEEED